MGYLSDYLREKQAGRWRPKFQRLIEKFERKHNENECDPMEWLGMKTTNDDLRYRDGHVTRMLVPKISVPWT